MLSGKLFRSTEGPLGSAEDTLQPIGDHLRLKEGPFRPSEGPAVPKRPSQTDREPFQTDRSPIVGSLATEGPLSSKKGPSGTLSDGPFGPMRGSLRLAGALSDQRGHAS